MRSGEHAASNGGFLFLGLRALRWIQTAVRDETDVAEMKQFSFPGSVDTACYDASSVVVFFCVIEPHFCQLKTLKFRQSKFSLVLTESFWSDRSTPSGTPYTAEVP